MSAKISRSSVARARAAMLLLGLLVTAACASPASVRYRTLADDWEHSRPAAAAPDAGARLFEGAAVLQRRELVRHVLERNPGLRAARHAWRAALARYPQVTALDDPVLSAAVAPRSFGSSRVDDAAAFDLSQRLPFPGKLRLRGEAALAEAEAAAHDHAAVRLRLATMASLLLDEYTLTARALEVNAEHVRLLGEFQRIATTRYETGEASQQDPIQAEVELTHAEHRKVLLGTRLRVTTEQLNALLHRRPDASLPPPPARPVVPAGLGTSTEQLVEQAVEGRPELAAAGARVAATRARVALARREYFPDFTLVGTQNRIHQESDLQPQLGVKLNLPLQLGRRRAALDEARARHEEALSRQLAVENEVRLAVHSGADRLAEAGHVARLFRDRLLPAARDQVDAARAGFETGRNSFLALIDAERNLLEVELGQEEALADVARRRAELDRAMGRIPGLTW